MISSLLSSAAAALRSINPSLPPAPPPPEEVTGQDVCFVGTEGGGDDVLCGDLPEGMRGAIGSWYLTPERHIVEYIVATLISLFVIRRVLPKIARYPDGLSGENVLRPSLPVRVISVEFFLIQFAYKCFGYPGKWLSMLLPCNVLWGLHAAVAFLPMSSHTTHVIIQLTVAYSGLAIVALAVPDTDDCVLPFEKHFFYLHHTMLLAFPAYYVGFLGGRVSLLPSEGSGETLWGNLARWHLLACALFAFFYFTIVTQICIYSGLNLNYMLSPPPNPGDVVSGPNFRIMSVGCCATLFLLVRYLAAMGEFMTGLFASKFYAPKKVV